MNLPNVKQVGSNAIKFGSATVGLVAGSKVANMLGNITLPAFIPAIVAEHLKKAAPGLLLMLAAWYANQKFKSKHEAVEPATLGVGLAGFASILKAYFPELAAEYLPSLKGWTDNQTQGMQMGELERSAARQIPAVSESLRMMVAA